MPLLETRHIVKRYGAVLANQDVHFILQPGTVHALVGQNGAGKTTLMNILYGMIQPDEGEILIDGEKVQFHTPRDALTHGLGMVHQHFMLIPPFSALENVVLGSEPRHLGLLDRKRATRQIRDIMDTWRLNLDLDVPVEDLSVGMRQRVEILRLLYQGAEILILDEPTAVLAPPEIEGLFSILRSLCSRGKSVIFISHKLKEVFEIAEVISVMRDGQIVATIDSDQASREEIAAWMVGEDGDRRSQHESKSSAGPSKNSLSISPDDVPPLLSLRSLSYREHGVPQLDGVDLTLHRGEILGIAGVEGNGQQALVDVLLGIRQADSGEIRVHGQPISRPCPRMMRDLGMAYIPADRQREGSSLASSIEENFLLGRQHQYSRYGVLLTQALSEEVAHQLDRYEIQAAHPNIPMQSLSGGNQQKLIIARELASEPAWILAVHPTRGLDIHAAEFVHSQLREWRDRDSAVLLISSDLDELLKLSDRIAVMYRGKFIRLFDAAATSEYELGRWMLGPPTY